MRSRDLTKAGAALRLLTVCWLAASLVSDLQSPRFGAPAAAATLITGSATFALALWRPGWAMLCLPVVALTGVASHTYPALIVTAAIVVGSLTVIRRHKEAAAAFLGACLVAIYVAYGPQHNDVLLWLMIPAMLGAGGLGVALGEIWHRQQQWIESVAAARELEELADRRERRDMATHLHDEIGHALALTAMIAETEAATASSESAAGFREIGRISRAGAEDLARVMSLLRGEAGFEPRHVQRPSAFVVALADTLRRCGWRVTLRWEERFDRFPTALAGLVDRFLTEATTNILKHGRRHTALSISSTITASDFTVTTTNRIGPGHSGASSSLGLRDLREAARALDASVSWREADGTWILQLTGNLEEIFGEGFVLEEAGENVRPASPLPSDA